MVVVVLLVVDVEVDDRGSAFTSALVSGLMMGKALLVLARVT